MPEPLTLVMYFNLKNPAPCPNKTTPYPKPLVPKPYTPNSSDVLYNLKNTCPTPKPLVLVSKNPIPWITPKPLT